MNFFHKGHELNVPVSYYIPPLKLGMYYRSELQTKDSWVIFPDMPRGENDASLRMLYLRFLDMKVGGFRYKNISPGIELN